MKISVLTGFYLGLLLAVGCGDFPESDSAKDDKSDSKPGGPDIVELVKIDGIQTQEAKKVAAVKLNDNGLFIAAGEIGDKEAFSKIDGKDTTVYNLKIREGERKVLGAVVEVHPVLCSIAMPTSKAALSDEDCTKDKILGTFGPNKDSNVFTVIIERGKSFNLEFITDGYTDGSHSVSGSVEISVTKDIEVSKILTKSKSTFSDENDMAPVCTGSMCDDSSIQK